MGLNPNRFKELSFMIGATIWDRESLPNGNRP